MGDGRGRSSADDSGMRCRSPFSLLCVLLASLVLTAPAYADRGNGRGADSAPAATAAPVSSSKTAVAASAVYVMRGRIVQIVAPSAFAVGSVSFRVTASNRLATRVRGMIITLALTRPTTLRPGALVTVRLRAPVDAKASRATAREERRT